MEPLPIGSELLKHRIPKSSTSIFQIGNSICVDGNSLSHDSRSIVNNLDWTLSDIPFAVLLDSHLTVRNVHPEKFVDEKVVVSFLESELLAVLEVLGNAENFRKSQIFRLLGGCLVLFSAIFNSRRLGVLLRSCPVVISCSSIVSIVSILLNALTSVSIIGIILVSVRVSRWSHSFPPCRIRCSIKTQKDSSVDLLLLAILSSSFL